VEKYTVIIPTRDRIETLGATLRTCLRQEYNNFEIIVCDNHSSDGTRSLVESYKDQRIRYINPGRRLSMSGNFEFALRHVTEGFVMFIGADDAMMPNAVQYVSSIVNKYQVDAVSCRQATYIWPNFPEKNIAGRFIFGGWRDDIEVRDSHKWINKALNFKTNYCFDLPNLYCGFVHKRIIDKAYKNGIYFKSMTPDAYSAFATAIFVDKYAFSNKPFSIAGASAKSNGAASMNTASSKEEVINFYSENDIDFHEKFVVCPSYEIIAAEAFSQLALNFPKECVRYKINYKAMLNRALSSVNIKTEDEVKNAVAQMAVNFNVDIKINNTIFSKFSNLRWGDLFYAITALALPGRFVAITKSGDFGVQNIDDAALIAHALERCRGSSSLQTNKKYIMKLICKLLRLQR
jgi:glycosyltransferase involved in cell wall biosynthesis